MVYNITEIEWNWRGTKGEKGEKKKKGWITTTNGVTGLFPTDKDANSINNNGEEDVALDIFKFTLARGNGRR